MGFWDLKFFAVQCGSCFAASVYTRQVSLSQGLHIPPHTLPSKHMISLEWPVYLMCMPLDYRKKPPSTARTCRLHADSPQPTLLNTAPLSHHGRTAFEIIKTDILKPMQYEHKLKFKCLDTQTRSRILLSLFCCIPSLDPKTKCGPFHSVTMTQSVTQPDYSACQPSNSEPSIICLAKKSGRPLFHSNSLPQTELSNKLDGLTNVQTAHCSINHLFKPLFIRQTSHPSSKS